MSLWTIFLTGLTTGGLTCVAVQGGLLAGYLATRSGEGTATWRSAIMPTALFLGAKLLVYSVLGFVLGALGGVFQLSLGLRVTLQIAVGLFMIVSALQLLNVHPFFQRFQLRTPHALRRVIRRSAGGESVGTPILLGLLTVFLPCGTTVAMEALAIGSASAARGGAIMATFVIGTVPLFFLIGVLAHAGMKAWQGHFTKATAAVLILIGLVTVNSGLVLSGSPLSAQALTRTAGNILARVQDRANGGGATSGPTASQENGVQKVTLNVTSSGYAPNDIVISAAVPVELTLVTNGTKGCSRAFTIPQYKVEKILPETGSTVVTFTPKKAGTIAFTCSMGMFSGTFTVI